MSSKWTPEERLAAALDVARSGDRICTDSWHAVQAQAYLDDPEMFKEQNVSIELACQRNALREVLKSAMAEILEHSREYHHVTKPEFFEKANAALEKNK